MDARVGQIKPDAIEWPQQTILGNEVKRSKHAPATRGLRGNQGYFVVVDFQADKAKVNAEVAALEAAMGLVPAASKSKVKVNADEQVSE